MYLGMAVRDAKQNGGNVQMARVLKMFNVVPPRSPYAKVELRRN
jgi:hypothetical protein